MGLFDKLRDTVDNAKNSINKAIESAQNANDPLSDPVVKQYFEIICGMRNTFLSTGPETVTGNEKAKKYIEYFLGTSCDREKLERALELYNLSRNDYPTQKAEIIVSDFRKSLTKSTRYQLNRYQAHKKFCQRQIEMSTAELNQIIDVIKDNANYRFFSQGLSKMHCDSIVKDIVIANSFCEGNPITRKVVLEYFIDTVVGRMNSETYTSLYDVTDDISLIVLKALHFEEYGKSREGYTTVTAQEYRDFVLNVNYYKGVIDKNPFDKEKYIEKFINKISQRQAVSGVYSSFKECHHITCVDNYFCDALCNLAWKAIAGVADWLNAYDENISNSRNVSDVFDILVTYFENTDDYDDLEIEQFCNEDKNGDIEVYNTISGDVRSRLEPVDLENE